MAQNSICHVEWSSTNFERTQKFYGGLFNWTFTPYGEEYLLFKCPDGIGGGFSKMTEVKAGASPIVYIEVDDVDSYVGRAAGLGGGTSLPKTELPNIGWIAILTDPDGNMVGLFQTTDNG